MRITEHGDWIKKSRNGLQICSMDFTSTKTTWPTDFVPTTTTFESTFCLQEEATTYRLP